MTKCPCGSDHRCSSTVTIVERLIERHGETMRVSFQPYGAPRVRSWLVPRMYLAMHGLKGVELPGLADKYGWQEVQ